MTCSTMPLLILDSLRSRPSRASAAAIGHRFVLNGAPRALNLLGIDALAEMICDWSVALLEEAVNDPSRAFGTRQYAISKLGELLSTAIDRGYSHATREDGHRLVIPAKAELEARKDESPFREIQAVEDLCNHVSQAVAEGIFEQLPDF